MEPVELLQHLDIDCIPNYAPHNDTKLDLKYAIEIADRFNIINEKLDSSVVGPVELVVPDKEVKIVDKAQPKPRKQQKVLV